MILILIAAILSLSRAHSDDAAFKKPFNYCLNYKKSCFCQSNERLECNNFSEFKELKLRDLTNDKKLTYIRIKPTSPLILDNRLDLNGLNIDHNRIQILFENLLGIELTSSPFESVNVNKQLNYLSISNSTLDFYYRNKTFDWICDLVLSDFKLKPLFSSFRTVFLGQLDKVKYPARLCPVVFKDANIDSLYLFNLTEENRPSFLQFNSSFFPISSLNSVINNVHIQSSHIRLDYELLDRNVFKYMRKLSIEFSSLSYIEPEILKGFKSLRQVNLWLFNFGEFIRSSNNKWLHYLNHDLNVNLSNSNQVDSYRDKQVLVEFNDEKNEYEYPDVDFCLFKYFPHHKLVYPLIKSSKNLNCTCTLIWLLRYSTYSSVSLKTDAVMDCLYNFDYMVRKCYLSERLKACFKPSVLQSVASASSLSAAKAIYLLAVFALGLLKL